MWGNKECSQWSIFTARLYTVRFRITGGSGEYIEWNE
jgi:hypothetical protein